MELRWCLLVFGTDATIGPQPLCIGPRSGLLVMRLWIPALRGYSERATQEYWIGEYHAV